MCVRAQDHHKGMSEEGRRRDEELDRQALLAEQRREEERLLQEEQQREKMERIRAVEGKMDGRERGTGRAWKSEDVCGLHPISCLVLIHKHSASVRSVLHSLFAG